MEYEELATLTDEELLEAGKKAKSDSIMSALLIGFMIGVVVYGVAKSNIGFFALIPVYFLFKVFHNPAKKRKNEAVKELMKERGLG